MVGEVQAEVGVVEVGELREQWCGDVAGLWAIAAADVAVGIGGESVEQIGGARGVAGRELSCVGAGFGEGVKVGGGVVGRGVLKAAEVGGGAGVGSACEKGFGWERGDARRCVSTHGGVGVGGEAGEGVGGGT